MMKKTLFFAGVIALCVSTEAMATFADDSVTSPAFTDSYASVASDNNRAAAGTYQYAAKAETDNVVRIKHATTKYVDARKAGAQQLVDDLTVRSTSDNNVVDANNTDLVGKAAAQQQTWSDKGLEKNRQVTTTPATTGECSQASLGSNYSGCGYIAKSAGSVDDDHNFRDYSHDSDDYQWVKIATHCLVDNTLEGCPGHQG